MLLYSKGDQTNVLTRFIKRRRIKYIDLSNIFRDFFTIIAF